MSTELPKELRSLVRQGVETLGRVVLEEAGQRIFDLVESIRLRMKVLRNPEGETSYNILKEVYAECARLPPDDRFKIAHAFALKLELINACENAYRTYRLKQKQRIFPEKIPTAIVFVLTAHPTESRAPEVISLFYEIQQALLCSLNEQYAFYEDQIRHLLNLAWKIPMSKSQKPSVKDEANHIYSILFRKPILRSLVEMRERKINFRLRTWVGGDKDGHPGVDAKAFRSSLHQSRQLIVTAIIEHLSKAKGHVQYLHQHPPTRELAKTLVDSLHDLVKAIRELKSLGANDGRRVVRFGLQMKKLMNKYDEQVGAPSSHLIHAKRLTEIFPALVVPIEFRENAKVLHRESNDPKKKKLLSMLRTLKSISNGANPRWYVRGVVISMVQSEKDLKAGLEIVMKVFRDLILPVVPLFETRDALCNARNTLKNTIRIPAVRKAISTHWKHCMEIMVGYSDSAKEFGAISSRLLIQKTLFDLEAFFRTHKITPVFFHGSGGSIARGGGSIEEQISWWPQSSRNFYKATVQGEMIQRTFASSEIVKSSILKIAQMEKLTVQPKVFPQSEALKTFIRIAEKAYQQKIQDDEFFDVIEKATAYRYLDLLRIGSRPTSRQPGNQFEHIRAIPWVLCWTQTRVLFPSWWGLGSAWMALDKEQKSQLCKDFKEQPILSSFLKLTGFTLEKIEMDIWQMYLETSNLSENLATKTLEEFRAELCKTLDFVKMVSAEDNLLWYRPWLGESIRLRSSMIHPLNLLQILALKDRDERLLQETATGIACGMLTTG